MTAESDKCGCASLLPMSCRNRAEAFAKRLHSRLQSLGSQDGIVDESSWLSAHESSISLSQPRHSTESDLYIDFGLLESPGSPEDEHPQPEFVLNGKNGCSCEETKALVKNRLPSSESDSSDGTYYDLDVEEGQNGLSNGTDKAEDAFESPLTSECRLVASESSSLPDEDYSSLEVPDLPTNGEVKEDTVKLNGKDEEVEHSKLNGEDVVDGDHPRLNGEVVEVYCSHIIIEKDLTIECPVEAEISVVPSVEISPSISEPVPVNFIDEENELEDRIPRVRRCSSLKTGKTPPGTPSRKKIVRFADVLGLDLADVRTFLDEIPKIPTSAYDDLKDVDLTETVPLEPKFQFGVKIEKMLMPMFQQPGGMCDFLDKVRQNQVCLENAAVTDPVLMAITGTVRVRNLDFNKSVHIRYTLDSWKTYADLQASYVQNSCDGFSDKFSFVLYANMLTIGQRLELAVRFHCKGCQYWDSNNGLNYCFQCLPASQSTTNVAPIASGNEWSASFY